LERLLPLGQSRDPLAQELIAFMHARGEGIPADKVAAFGWFMLAAEAGRTDAQYELGQLYRDGLGTPINSSAAMLWFSRAADQGAAKAMNAIGELHLGRSDLAADYTAAFEWFTRAAEHGSAQAMLNIGFLYTLGRGVDRNEIEAFKWFDLAVREGPDGPHHRASQARMAMAERLTPMEVRTASVNAVNWTKSHRISSSDRIK
jgi:TPR repeat protein